MKHTLLKAALVASLVASALYAQDNARIQGLAGSDIVPDISRTLSYNPSYIANYKNEVQASFNSPILGSVSINNTLSIGAALNTGLVLKNFYTVGAAALNAIPAPAIVPADPMNANTQYYPHLLIGLDLSAVKLGFEPFVEWSSYSYKSTTTGLLDTKSDLNLRNFGLIAGANMALGDLSLAFVLGGGLPQISGSVDAAGGETKAESEQGAFVKVGAEVEFPLMALRMTAGAHWTMESFQFNETAPAPAAKVRDDKYAINTVTPYVGLHGYLGDKILFVVMDKSALTFSSIENDAGNDNANATNFTHNLSTGFEKQFPSVWIFDSLALRGGVAWTIVNNFTGSKTSATVGGVTNTTETSQKMITTFGPAQPSLGFGVSKSFFGADVVVNPAAWTGLISGPAVARATVSLKF